MNMKSLLSILLISFFICSCKKELEPQDNSDAVYSQPADQSSVATTPENVPVAPAVTTQTTAPVQMVQPQANPQPVANANKSGMNPAHGQPGHRCDIAVGAPLNSSPAKKANPSVPATTTTITPTQTASAPGILKTDAAATPTTPGMNPPHGQEGHRCDIAVGAALPKSE